MELSIHDNSIGVAAPRLLTPLTLRGQTLRNRIVVSPMCQYLASDGQATDWHLVHLGRFAMGGAGMVMTEAVAVEARGRITHGDLGLWCEHHRIALARVAAVLKANGAVPAIQLAHAGRKASMQRPWFGNGPLDQADAARGDHPWPVVGPSATPVAPRWLIPAALTADELAAMRKTWIHAAQLAVDAGFEAIEVHCAHGYLLHQFLSPLSNQRSDAYGGEREGRMRFPLEIVEAVRSTIPKDMPLLVRVSSVDGVEGGWTLSDTLVFAAALRERGVDVVDCSSGGLLGSATGVSFARRPGFQVPFASAVKREAGIRTMAVGLILSAAQAEAILAEDAADLVALGREFLVNPNWAMKASIDLLGQDGYKYWPQNAGWWLSRRKVDSTS